MIGKATKKPITIEYIQYDGTEEKAQEVREFVGKFLFRYKEGFVIATSEGEMQVSKDDYIIKGIKGEFYPCKPDIFEMTYDIVS